MPGVAAPEAAHVVAIAAVPLRPAPAEGEAADLVQPAASHGSAISLVSASTPSSAIISTTGGSTSTLPWRSRPKTEARSKRRPSTCMSATQ